MRMCVLCVPLCVVVTARAKIARSVAGRVYILLKFKDRVQEGTFNFECFTPVCMCDCHHILQVCLVCYRRFFSVSLSYCVYGLLYILSSISIIKVTHSRVCNNASSSKSLARCKIGSNKTLRIAPVL